jgi:uncharacterized protein YbjQ (UPF0145 family)
MSDEVRLFPVSWVPNARAEAYFGPIKTHVFVADRTGRDRSLAWELAEERMERRMRALARDVSEGLANAVVGLEVSWDLEAKPAGGRRRGLMLSATGTAARLERLFKDVPY